MDAWADYWQAKALELTAERDGLSNMNDDMASILRRLVSDGVVVACAASSRPHERPYLDRLSGEFNWLDLTPDERTLLESCGIEFEMDR